MNAMDDLRTVLSCTLVLLINLVRQPDRRDVSSKLLGECGLTNVSHFSAVDGAKLKAAGGRLRKVKKRWRISYDCEAGPDVHRVVDYLRVSSLAAAGGADVWAQYGCLRSHEAALKMVRAELQRAPFCLICEDDLMLGKSIKSPSEFLPRLADFVLHLTSLFPDWFLLLLGGSAVFGYNDRNAFSPVKGVRHAGYVMQAHACLWRKAPQSDSAIQMVLEFMRSGFHADNALASTMSRHPGLCFCVDPALLAQNPLVPSNLQVWSPLGGQSGYNAAHLHLRASSSASVKTCGARTSTSKPKKTVVVKKRPSASPSSSKHHRTDKKSRGKPDLHPQALQKLRAGFGRKGGLVKAGGACNAKVVSAKVQHMKQWFQKHKVFPSRSLAQSKWSVGKSLWSSTRSLFVV